MRVLFALLVCSCSYTARPADVVRPQPVMCQPINEDVWDCRDGLGELWRCDVMNGRWNCYRLMVLDSRGI